LAAVYTTHRLHRSHWGLNFKFIGQADSLAESLGIDIMWHKVFAFVMGAIFAGFAGSVFAHYHHYIAPDFFTFAESVGFITFIVVGGAATVWGPVVGAMVLTIIPEMLGLTKMRPLFYGGLLIVVVIFFQQGIIHIPALVAQKFRKK